MIRLTLKLARVARSKGGDRYEADVRNDKPLVIYLPQSITRKAGIVIDELEMTLKPTGD